MITSDASVGGRPALRRQRPSPTGPMGEHLRRVQRLIMQGELAATAVHEISNLQTIVLFNAGLLREEHKDDPAVTRYVEPLLHAATLIASLCSQLRDLAHPGEAQPRRLDLVANAQRTHQLLDQIINRHLLFEAPAGRSLDVVADPGQIDQMMINLVLNARDATTDEAGRIVVRIGETRGRRPFLEVEDNGTGMTPEVKSRLFEKFFTTKQAGEGTGLGLATVHRLLTGMGGRVAVSTRVGRGTRIRLLFPRPPAEEGGSA